jgi:hypothetical protein
MEYGVWSMEYGVWSMEYGVWSMEYGVWSMGADAYQKQLVILSSCLCEVEVKRGVSGFQIFLVIENRRLNISFPCIHIRSILL